MTSIESASPNLASLLAMRPFTVVDSDRYVLSKPTRCMRVDLRYTIPEESGMLHLHIDLYNSVNETISAFPVFTYVIPFYPHSKENTETKNKEQFHMFRGNSYGVNAIHRINSGVFEQVMQAWEHRFKLGVEAVYEQPKEEAMKITGFDKYVKQDVNLVEVILVANDMVKQSASQIVNAVSICTVHTETSAGDTLNFEISALNVSGGTEYTADSEVFIKDSINVYAVGGSLDDLQRSMTFVTKMLNDSRATLSLGEEIVEAVEGELLTICKNHLNHVYEASSRNRVEIMVERELMYYRSIITSMVQKSSNGVDWYMLPAHEDDTELVHEDFIGAADGSHYHEFKLSLEACEALGGDGFSGEENPYLLWSGLHTDTTLHVFVSDNNSKQGVLWIPEGRPLYPSSEQKVYGVSFVMRPNSNDLHGVKMSMRLLYNAATMQQELDYFYNQTNVRNNKGVRNAVSLLFHKNAPEGWLES